MAKTKLQLEVGHKLEVNGLRDRIDTLISDHKEQLLDQSLVMGDAAAKQLHKFKKYEARAEQVANDYEHQITQLHGTINYLLGWIRDQEK